MFGFDVIGLEIFAYSEADLSNVLIWRHQCLPSEGDWLNVKVFNHVIERCQDAN